MVLRNPEAARFFRLFCIISALGAFVCFSFDSRAGFAAIALCAVLLLFWYLSQRRNYQNMAKLAAEIDELLHSGRDIQFSACKEGELSLLEAEISKLTVKLKEQTAQLEKDKTSLADSMANVSHQLRTSLTAMHLVLTAMGSDTTAQALQTHRRTLRRHLDRMDLAGFRAVKARQAGRGGHYVSSQFHFLARSGAKSFRSAACVHGTSRAGSCNVFIWLSHLRPRLDSGSAGEYPEKLYGAYGNRNADHYRF